MDIFLGVLVGAVIAAVAVALLLRGRAPRPATPGVDASAALGAQMSLLAQRLEGIDQRMSDTNISSHQMAAGIFDALGKVQEATSSVADQARQFSSLQDMLRAPKARGGIGEAMLEELLRQVLPPQAYAMQHRFSTGLIVDAVVKAGGRLVSIDSKFPLANFRRMCDASEDLERETARRAFAADVDTHVRAIATRYIVPADGTLDFAVMYVPAEGVYGELLRLSHRKRSIFETAIEARVIPMSPLTLFGYLQTVLFGLKCLRIERSAEEILAYCGQLREDMSRFADEYDTLGGHIGRARSKFEEGARRLTRLRAGLEHVQDFADDTSTELEASREPERRPFGGAGARPSIREETPTSLEAVND